MLSKVKGFTFVLSNTEFLEVADSKSSTRRGTDVDLANVTHLFKEIGYEVFQYKNLTGQVSVNQEIVCFYLI